MTPPNITFKAKVHIPCDETYTDNGLSAHDKWIQLQAHTAFVAEKENKPLAHFGSIEVSKKPARKDENTITHKTKKRVSNARKAQSVPFIPLARKKPAKRIIAKTTNIKAYYNNGNDSVVNGKITPIDSGMNAIATLAGDERDTCPAHKSKRIR